MNSKNEFRGVIKADDNWFRNKFIIFLDSLGLIDMHVMKLDIHFLAYQSDLQGILLIPFEFEAVWTTFHEKPYSVTV